jgi:hypothetical protein
MFPDTAYPTRFILGPSDSRLHVYSDGGAFEVTTAQGHHWTLGELQDMLLEDAGSESGGGESKRILRQIFALAGRESLEDDSSRMVCTFPG